MIFSFYLIFCFLNQAFASDTVLQEIEKEKKNALIKAWEENEKAKIDHETYKKKSGIGGWEKTKIALVEAELKKIEEELEKKKA